MRFKPISVNGKEISLRSAVLEPDFIGQSVISENPWDYVSLWLRRKSNNKALIYWQQSHEFYNASMRLSQVSSPLTSYYCILNATKALLTYKNVTYQSNHGISGYSKTGKKCLKNEIVEIKQSGVLPSLCSLLSESVTQNEHYSLKDLFYFLPFIHRAFTLTYKSVTEFFIPLKKPLFVVKSNDTEAWFCAELDENFVSKYSESQLQKILPIGYEIDKGVKDRILMRKTRRFSWIQGQSNRNLNLQNLSRYHAKIRKDIVPIFAPVNQWYAKKNLQNKDFIQVHKSQLPIIFMAMHRLSELSRYEPVALTKHLDAQHNWILTEFLKVAPAQLINHVACEITGKEFLKPYTVSL